MSGVPGCKHEKLAPHGCITAGGVATIDRYAFGVTKAKGMTGRHLNISLEIVAHR
ncbi:hypothetical protein AB0D46_13860 [Streptomyces sp. NPDC048383]|uniref:hypothetical protein n=1 Tax=Streptomyces sp. NPDC048383 TaxID=3155386 RepID=UPI0034416B1F